MSYDSDCYLYICILCFWCHFFTIVDNPLLLERVTACCPIATSCEPRDAVENLVAQEGQRAWVACSNLPLDLHRVCSHRKILCALGRRCVGGEEI